ncbi:MAG: (2Fe-2S) ferredoxin domain-containing protein [Ruthenibacterium sp.]
MKSLEELAAIRDKMKSTVNTRESAHDSSRVVVGMATCGIAAGARPVLSAFTEEIAKENLPVLVTQTGCIGICQYEPVVEVYMSGKDKVTYVNMTAEKVKRVVAEHLMRGIPVTEYTIGAAIQQ